MSHGQIGIFRTKNPAALIIALFFCLSTPCYALDVTLSWNVSDGATGYKVYYNTFSSTSGPPYNGTGAKEGPSPIDVNNLTQFTLHNLSDGGYRFAVRAYNEYGESDYSAEVVLPPIQYPPSVVAGLPFTEDFESGNLAECWEIRSTGAGRTLVTSSDDPLSGNYHLTMDSSQNGTFSLNELILTLDLSGQSDVILGFHHKEFNDEDHVMPNSFSGSHNSDGVAISADGTTWYKVQGLTSADGISSGGTFYTVNLDSAVTAQGIKYNNTFKIKFQHYDNYSIGGDYKDGFAFDDIAVYQIIADADQDELPDDWELSHFNNLTQDPDDDWDSDELNNLSEYQLGTEPCDSDSDADGMLDGWEVHYGLDPIDAADADKDLDGDGQTNLEEHAAGTDPTVTQSPTPPTVTQSPSPHLPFSEDFESGNLAECWEIRSTGAGRTLVTTSDNPLSGSYHLTMDSSRDGTYSLNELILTLDLSGQSDVILGFHHKEFNDEDHVMPDRFSGSHNSDGVAISPDGTTWYKVQGLTSADGISSGGAFYTVDLDSAVTAWGIKYNNTFKIKFQHYDNYSIANDYKDGFAFDDVEVYQAGLQFTEDFESGELAECWEIRSTGAGRTLVTTSNDPLSGNYHLTMDSSQNGTFSLNELILTLDLSGQSDVILGFLHKEFKDEDHVMPNSFSGSHNSDGVAISPDGTTWYKVQGLTSTDGISSGGTLYTVDLDSTVTAWGIKYNNTFKIKFQHYDNYSITNDYKDGFAFDDVSIDVR